MSDGYKIWGGLLINGTQTISGITDDSGLTSSSTIVPTTNAVRGYVDNVLSTSISTEISNRTVADESVMSALSTSISTAISTETSILSTAISTESSILVTAISSETSLRTSADESLASAISSGGGGGSSLFQTSGSTPITFIGGTGTTIDWYLNNKNYAVYNYCVYSGSTNLRAGIITIVNNTLDVKINESSTQDIGNTTGIVTFSAYNNNNSDGRIRLCIIITEGEWVCEWIKTIK